MPHGSLVQLHSGRPNTTGCVQGMHAFNLIRDTASCPMCHNGIKPVICAFRGCAWLYEGRKLGPDGTITHCSSDWEVRSCAAAVPDLLHVSISLAPLCSAAGLSGPVTALYI